METGNRQTAARGKEGRGKLWKAGESISQRICMNDPWTWTMNGVGTNGENGDRMGGRGQRGKIGKL